MELNVSFRETSQGFDLSMESNAISFAASFRENAQGFCSGLTEDDALFLSIFDETIVCGTTCENLDPVLTEQDVMIARIKAALQGKVIGGNEPTTISGVNLHDTATDIPNTYISGASVLAYNGWTSTDYIRVEEGKYYLAYSTSAINSNYCSKFDSSKENAKAVGGVINCTSKSRPAFMPGHDGYLRFSGTKAQIAALEFYEVANFNWEV